MRKSMATLGSVAIVLATASFALGQQRQLGQEQQQQLRGQQQGQAGQTGQMAEKLAAWLACGNILEVELGQLAAQRASDQQVRQFAQQMVQEHTQVLQQLRQINPQIQVPAGGQGRTQPGQQAQGQAQRGAAAGQQAGGASQDPLIQIAEQACRRKLELTRGILEQKQGQEFDKAYIGEQIVAHINMLAELEAMQNVSAPELQQIVTNAARSTQEHLQHAMQIAQTLEGGEGGEDRLSRRPQRQQQEQQQDRQQQERQPDQE